MAKLYTCAALICFTRFVSGHGLIHGDPDSTIKAAREPKVPEVAVPAFVRDGLVSAPADWEGETLEIPEEFANAGKNQAGESEDLTSLTKDKLLEIAEAEAITVKATSNKAEIVAAIVDARAAKLSAQADAGEGAAPPA